ncbi:MAG TPA: GNAT family N-acetyltransferase [Thermoanaerobaculia bacterium]|nr:GNAT family N-acetyltransferase [Thermoanaerobaculia bacterium]
MGIPPARLHLRDIRSEDFEALHRLDQLCFEPGIAYSRQELLAFLELPTREGVVAEVGESAERKLAGFAVGALADRRIGRVITLDVAPHLRRRGTGRALLEELLSRLSRAGARRAILEVDAGNTGAIAFYRRFGFRSRRRIPNYYAPGRTALEMEASLVSLIA